MSRRRANPRWLPAALAILLCAACGGAGPDGEPRERAGRDLYVDPRAGDDRADGLAPAAGGDRIGPVRTIARGLRLARAGDTVHLATAVYRESALFHDRRGEPGRPITLDGHGATLEGSDPLVPADWDEVAPGLYRNDHLIRPDLLTRDDSVVRRWFFVFDGRAVHMGRTMKGPSLPLKRPEDLAPGEWTIVPAEHAFYVRVDPSRSLADARIAAPVRGAAVALGGDCAHLVVRNVNGTHVHNDGFNIHGVTRDVAFENIGAFECGDDGFSAHDDCAVRVDGFRSVGNSTGIANAGRSTSENRRVWIEGCLGIDLLILDEGPPTGSAPGTGSSRHTLADSVVLSSASRCLVLDGARGGGEPCRLSLENVLIRRAGPAGEARLSRRSALVADRVTMLGVRILAEGGELEFRRSILGGDPAPEVTLRPGASWRADGNRYDLRALRIGPSTYSADTLDDLRRSTGQDAHSRWAPLPLADGVPRDAGPDLGADPSRLPGRP
jgi:hypothetical protein